VSVPLDEVFQSSLPRPCKCARCKKVVLPGEPFRQLGSRRLCPECFSEAKAREEARRAKKEAEGQKKRHEPRKVEPLWLPDGKYACPECRGRDALSIVDYGLARDPSKGTFYFVVDCKRCRVRFTVQKDV